MDLYKILHFETTSVPFLDCREKLTIKEAKEKEDFEMFFFILL